MFEMEIDWRFRERWYSGMADACIKRHEASFKVAGLLERLFLLLDFPHIEYDNGLEEARKWRRKAELARLY